MSRRTAIAASAVVFVAIVAGLPSSVRAANFHQGPTLICSDCHVSHASLAHDQEGTGVGWSLQPAVNLIKAATVTELCLGCHDNQPGIPDVRGADANSSQEQYDGSERAAGAFVDSSGDGWKAHNLPGQGSSGPGECVACHDPHGNSNYRNLKALDGSLEGPVAFVDPGAAGLDAYRASSIGYARNIGDKLCQGCHSFGPAGGASGATGAGRHTRHPSSGAGQIVTMGGSGDSVDLDHWLSGLGSGFVVDGQPIPRVPFAVKSATDFVTAAAVSPDNEVFCLSCHKAHGSPYAFALRHPYGQASHGLHGAAGCNQCHNVSER